jgi:hypothetical protein
MLVTPPHSQLSGTAISALFHGTFTDLLGRLLPLASFIARLLEWLEMIKPESVRELLDPLGTAVTLVCSSRCHFADRLAGTISYVLAARR